LAPPNLAARLHSLPPILHKPTRSSLPSCSKGAQGLSVFPRVCSVFTANSISLSLRLRQWGSRHAIRAGRNLPDKEFRYLRTVRSTAAVCWSLNSMLSQILFAFQHRADVGLFTSLYYLAESCVFTKQSLPPSCATVPYYID